MKQILFATSNEAKVKRFAGGLKKCGIEIISLKDLDFELDIEENGKDAIQNALIKARAYAGKLNIPVMAMDDNLFLEGVPESKQPGVFVRRINGKRLNDNELLLYYIDLVKKYGQKEKINARWVYGLAIINNKQEFTYTWSKNDFYLVSKPSKIMNAGYPLNSISINPILNKYFSELTLEDSEKIKQDESDVINFIADHI